MRRIDNQIDVISKTFLGLTVACARCHDHKFDPITSKDYYALAGFLRSSRHQQAFIDSHQRVAPAIAKLSSLKSTIASLLREAMSQAPERFGARSRRLGPRVCMRDWLLNRRPCRRDRKSETTMRSFSRISTAKL